MKHFLLRTTMFVWAALALPAVAHHIWLEPAGPGTTMLHFGEYHLNLRETSPGLLDGFTATRFTLHDEQDNKSPSELTADKTANGLRIAAAAHFSSTLVARDDNVPLHTWIQNGKATTGWFHFGARLIGDRAPQTPTLTLDITPGPNPGQWLLTFQGKPLPNTKVQALTASGWLQEKNTNAQGLVQFDLPWRGLYVFKASHMLPTPGERDGKKYDLVGYVTTLTYFKPQGLATLDAAPVMKPGAEH